MVDEDDKGTGRGATLVLRDLPSKQSSVIMERAPQIPSLQEATTISDNRVPPSPSPSPARTAVPSWNVDLKQIRAGTGKGRFPLPSKPVLASVEPRESAPAPVDSWSPAHRRQDMTSTLSSDDRPEEATAFGPPRLHSLVLYDPLCSPQFLIALYHGAPTPLHVIIQRLTQHVVSSQGYMGLTSAGHRACACRYWCVI